MEDYDVAKFMQIEGHELGLFAIYDSHLGDTVPSYLQKHFFSKFLVLRKMGNFFSFRFLGISIDCVI